MTQRRLTPPMTLAGSLFVVLLFIHSHNHNNRSNSFLAKNRDALSQSLDNNPSINAGTRFLEEGVGWNKKIASSATRATEEEDEKEEEGIGDDDDEEDTLEANSTNVEVAGEDDDDNEVEHLEMDSNNAELIALAQKLQPESFNNNATSLTPHQFVHLHIMKTGGTSVDHVLECAMKRLNEQTQLDVPYYNLHECRRSYYRECLAGNKPYCTDKLSTSAILSFCAPLQDLPKFGWEGDSYRAMTVLRHPVDRVWSYFRFSPKFCFKCRNLTDVYRAIDGVDATLYNVTEYDALCLKQLQNHETRNLQWKGIDMGENATDTEKVQQAIYSMKHFFTIVGLTSHLKETHDMIGQVFPWLNVTVKGSDTACPLPHDNSTPKNNHCMSDNSHWKLPSQPDEETRKMIEEHNQLDLKLYEAAMEYFELEKRALSMGEASS